MGVYKDVTLRAKTAAPKRRLTRPMLTVGVVVGIFLAVLVVTLLRNMTADSLVPTDVSKAVSFPVYYPKQSKLPAGYSLDTESFKLAQEGVIIYSVQKGDQKLVFSEEATPGGTIVDKFTSDYIPLHNTISTSLGKAQMGSVGQGANLQTIVSMPITNGPWLIVTAPAATKQSDMQQILQSLTK